MIKDKDYSWFIVEGCPRSGTTILTQVLNTHEKIGITTEKNIIKLKASRAKLNSIYSDIFEDKKSIIYFGDKLPGYIYHENQLKFILRNFKTIHISRDPVRVLSSMRVRTRSSRRGKDPTWNQFYGVMMGISSWIESWNYAVRNKRNPNFLHIKFEDLMGNPAKELGRISNFLDISNNFDYSSIRRLNGEIKLDKREIRLVNKYLGRVVNNWNKPLDRLEEEFSSLRNVPFSRIRREIWRFLWGRKRLRNLLWEVYSKIKRLFSQVL